MRLKKEADILKKIKNFNFLITVLALLFIAYCLYLSAFPVMRSDIGFNTDLARDFLLLEDIQKTHKIPLIGPRSGGIPGVFHGPLWIYVNLPAYILGGQNPVSVGWFWILLVVCSIAITYFVGRKVFGHVVGILAASLVAVSSITTSFSLFNPYGAVIISPLFIYFFYKYFTDNKVINLIISIFLLGIIIQFQVAFGAPLLILATIIVSYSIIKKRKFNHFLAFLILAVPMSTYAVFDLRHNFLELRSLIEYISGKSGHVNDFTFLNLIHNRYDGFINSLVIVPYPSRIIILISLFIFLYILYNSVKSREKYTKFILLFTYFFVGYWAISFMFKGVVWNYYYWPFMPILAIVIASGFRLINKYIFTVIFSIILFSSFVYSSNYMKYVSESYLGRDSGSWQFNLSLANAVLRDKEKEFSFYIFSPDQFGYSPRYAMNYLINKNPNINAKPYVKSKITYLIVSPPGGKGGSIGGEWWKVNRVKMNGKPVKIINFENGFKVEKYILSESEMLVPSDPNLIDSLIFR